MGTSPIEFTYRPNQIVYCFRSQVSTTTAYFYNTVSGAYEAYNSSNWANYAIAVPEVAPGYYRAIPPAASLSVQATELFYQEFDTGVGPQVSDAASGPIGVGNSQGVNIATVDGSIFTGFSPTAVVDIVNMALTHIGQGKIATLNDATENARKANIVFTNCVKEVMRDCWWNFTTVIALLALNADQTTNAVAGWNYVYDIPSDCLLVRKIYGESGPLFDLALPFTPDNVTVPITNPFTLPFRVLYSPTTTKKQIVCNINPVYIEYTAFIVDVTLWDADFIKALTFKLAAELGGILTGSRDKVADMKQNYVIAMSEAQKLNGNEDGVPRRQKNNFLDART